MLPDPPYIRDAENFGPPLSDDRVPVCPVCGISDPERIYTDLHGNALGCENCVNWVDAYDWMLDHGDE